MKLFINDFLKEKLELIVRTDYLNGKFELKERKFAGKSFVDPPLKKIKVPLGDP